MSRDISLPKIAYEITRISKIPNISTWISGQICQGIPNFQKSPKAFQSFQRYLKAVELLQMCQKLSCYLVLPCRFQMNVLPCLVLLKKMLHLSLNSYASAEERFHCSACNQEKLRIPWILARLMKIVVVSLFDRLMIATTTTHNQTNQKFGQKLMNLALMLEAKSLGPFYTITAHQF